MSPDAKLFEVLFAFSLIALFLTWRRVVELRRIQKKRDFAWSVLVDAARFDSGIWERTFFSGYGVISWGEVYAYLDTYHRSSAPADLLQAAKRLSLAYDRDWPYVNLPVPLRRQPNKGSHVFEGRFEDAAERWFGETDS